MAQTILEELSASAAPGIVQGVVFDPVFSELEKAALRELGWLVVEKNEEGKRGIATPIPFSAAGNAAEPNPHSTGHGGQPNQPRNCLAAGSVFFMPHCPFQLYSNVLWRNWGPSLRDLVIVGNSFTAYDQRIISRTARNNPSNCVLRLAGLTSEYPFAFQPPDLELLSYEGTSEEVLGDSGLMWWPTSSRARSGEEPAVPAGGLLPPGQKDVQAPDGTGGAKRLKKKQRKIKAKILECRFRSEWGSLEALDESNRPPEEWDVGHESTS